MKTLFYLTVCMLLSCSVARAHDRTLGYSQKTSIKTDSTANQLPIYNLFYLSKYLSNSSVLTFEQKHEIYLALIELIGKNKVKDVPPTDATSLGKFLKGYDLAKKQWISDVLGSLNPEVRADYTTLKGSIKSSLSIEIPIKSSADTTLKELLKIDSNFVKISNKLSQEAKTLQTIKDIFKRLSEIAPSDSTDIVNITDNNSKLSLTSDPSKNIILTEESKDAIVKNILKPHTISYRDLKQKFVTEIENYKKYVFNTDTTRIGIATQYNKKYDDFINELSSLAKLSTGRSLSSHNSNLTKLEALASTATLQIVTTTQNAQQGLSYSGLSMPSQSQMIEAMAIFLSKRAKQELAIWFMDELRARLQNPLIYDTFPETIALLEGLEDYHTPNFGKSWRHAIASDFVKMPENLVNSAWMEASLPEKDYQQIKTGVTFGYDLHKLIMERYNYRDIIRHLYLDPKYTNSKDQLSKELKQSFNLLYILTNEFFTIQPTNGSDSFRLLSYEELRTMNTEQWSSFINLLQLKYGSEFTDIYNPIATKFTSPNGQIQTTKWISTLLIALGQFDRINQEQQKLRAENNLDKNDASFASVWKVLNQVIQSIDVNPYLNETHSVQAGSYIQTVQNILGIIENIQDKNFVAATQKTLKLVEQYYNTGDQTIPTALKLGEDSFKIANGQMLMSANNGSYTANFSSKHLECISIVKSGAEGIIVNYNAYGKKKQKIELNKNLLPLIQRIVSLSSKMSSKDAIQFMEESLKKFKDSQTAAKYISQIKKNEKVQFEVLKAVALYVNLTQKSPDLKRQKILFNDGSFKIGEIRSRTQHIPTVFSIKSTNGKLSIYSDDAILLDIGTIKSDLTDLVICNNQSNTFLSYKSSNNTTELDLDSSKLVSLIQMWNGIKDIYSNDRISKIAPKIKELKDSLVIKAFENNNNAFIEVLQLLPLHEELRKEKSEDSVLNIVAKLGNKDLKAEISVANLVVGKKHMDQYGVQLVKLASFFGDVMSTKDETQLSNVIESHSLPPTSYKMKRKMHSSWDLNAYVGTFAGYLYTCSNSSLDCQWTGGITAPIGVTYTPPWGNRSLSLNAQVIDLGNIVNHYIVTPDSAYNKEVHFTEVLSPGVNILWGIRNTPMVAFLGISGTPLRSYKEIEDGPWINNRVIDAWTVKLGIKIDIPLVNLYSRVRSK